MASRDVNTVAMLGRAYSLLGFRIVDGVVGAGHPQKPSWSAVFAQISPKGTRSTELARGAGMTPQSMGQIIDEMEQAGYVRRVPDPTDRRAKLVVLTDSGRASIRAGARVIPAIEDELEGQLGTRDYRALQRILGKILLEQSPTTKTKE